MKSNSGHFEELELGDVAFESKDRAESQAVDDLRVYGVDRTDGLTPDAKYTSKNLGRYKVLKPAMFAYNPMRLNIGSIAYCTARHRAGLVSPDYVVFGCKKDKLDSDFFSYFIKGPVWKQWTTAAGVGSVRVRIYFRELARMPITLPPLAEQKAIAAVLGALDDKIELNRRTNATLEAMARALFQSWFVDFDPVRAKLDGHHPNGIDKASADLFPDHLEDSPLGHIPKGWTIRPLGEVADLNWGDTSKTKASYVENGFTAYSASGADGYLPSFDFDRTGVVVSAIGANAGVTWLANGKWSCIKNTLRFWATDSNVSTEYLFFATHGRARWPQRGSAQPFISQGDARAISVLIPSDRLAISFASVVRPWLARIEANEKQSRTLATLRDTLLPKLLSGELSISP